MPTVTSADGARIAYSVTGADALPPLLLIHGSFSDSSHWSAAVPHFAPRVQVYAVDRRGHGESDPYQEACSVEGEAGDIVALLESIRRPAFVVGHSSGAHVALHAAARSPFVAKLVLYEPPPLNPVAPESLEELRRLRAANDRPGAARLILEIMGRSTGKILPPAAVDALLQLSFGRMLQRNAFAAPEELAGQENYRLAPERFCSMAAPTLFLIGENSPPNYRVVTDKLYSFLPDSRIRILPGQEHGAMITAPELFARTVTEFCLGERA